MTKPIAKLHSLGQSLWYDNIQRRLLENGEMEAMVQRGEIRGVTSNPTIFNNAISKSNDYDLALTPMAWAGWKPEQIFNVLAIQDIQKATDIFMPLYEASKGQDGYVSLEVSPYLAHDTDATVSQARLLWQEVNRPNLMIKIPATQEGIKAITEVIASGVNVNVTLIFSLERYEQVIDAFMSGLERRLEMGLPVSDIASVASFFVSRVDTKVDALLEAMAQKNPGSKEIRQLLGKAAIANTKLAYRLFQDRFDSPRFQNLRKKGAQVQRPLWASTSTKNPNYRDVIYVEELIGAQTVNTVPPQTLVAFGDHGKPKVTITGGLDKAKDVIEKLESIGISMKKVTQELEDEGVESFSKAFTELLGNVEKRCRLIREKLGPLSAKIPAQVERMDSLSALERFFHRDPTLWTGDPAGQAEIIKRMGWANLPLSSQALIGELDTFVKAARKGGFTHVLLLGMGGSSLAPEVFAQVFGALEGGLDLKVLDSTDPRQVKEASAWSDVKQTLYVVASKSGTTSEIDAMYRYFWKQVCDVVGEKSAGKHFVAITDPGTPLESLGRQKNFRKVFLADPEVGGRNSALSVFGLLPAALVGIDIAKLLQRAQFMMEESGERVPPAANAGFMLGVIMGQACLQGRDKLTLITDDALTPFASWLEQLIAESSGKDNRGIVPVVGERLDDQARFGKDRLFVYLRLQGKKDKPVEKLSAGKQPVVVISLRDEYDLGAEFYRWELATAFACAVIGVNPFDQPDVQDSKTRTKKLIADYEQAHKLDEGQPLWANDEVKLFGKPVPAYQKAKQLTEVLEAFLAQKKSGDYLAIMAYLPRSKSTEKSLESLRQALQQKTGLAITLGFGPRYLHSTGQLHKGGSNNGLFIQITQKKKGDIDIPDAGFSFGVLEDAQALGDLHALLGRKRRVLRVHLDRMTFAQFLETINAMK